ncbi:hypothetical protein ABZ671_18560 [Micromonospora sp. NPDC006766]|uniref:hypothetical protein n=1 Tax=Micromonospora sp. NPDC006766 TaxID=3154778 RepID=UPI0033C9A086
MTQPGKGEDAGQLDLSVVADLRGFVRDLRRRVNEAAAKVQAKVQVKVKTTGLRTELRNAVKEASEKSKITAKIGVRIPVADFRRAVREVAEKAKARAKIGVQIPVTEMRRAVKEAGDKAKAKVRVDADTKPARRAIDRLKDAKAEIKVKADTSDFHAKLKKATSAAGKFALVAAKGLGLGLLAASAAGAAANILGFAGAILTALNAVWLAPAAIGGLAAILGTVKLALSGVGDAVGEVFKAYATLASGGKLTAAEQEKLNDALDQLSPSARRFVKELGRLAPALNGLRLDVQERFFKGLNVQVRDLAARYLPVLKTGLGEISAELNGGMREALSWLDSKAASSSLAGMLDNTAGAARDLLGALGPIGLALLKIGDVGSSFLPGLSEGLAGWAAGWAEKIGQVASDGRLHQWIQDGLDMLGQLWQMGSDVVGILRGVFDAAKSATDGGAFGMVGQLLSTLNEAANSAEGQQALIAVFQGLAEVGAALNPVVKAVVAGLAPLSGIIGDLATALSPGLTILVDALAEGLRLMAPAAGPVGQALSDIAVALAPLLPMLGAQLANGLSLLAGILSTVAREAGPLLGVFGEMATEVAATLLPVIEELIAAGLGPAAEAGIAIAKAFMPLVPVVVELAKVIASKLMEHLPALQSMLAGELVPAIAKIAEALSGAFLDALLAVAPQLPDMVDAGLRLAEAFTELVVAIIPFLPQLMQMGLLAIKLLPWLFGLAEPISTVADLITGMLDAGDAFNQWLSDAASAVGDFFSDAGQAVEDAAGAIGDFFTETLPGWLDSAGEWFAALPGRIGEALSDLPGQVAAFFEDAAGEMAYWVGYGVGLVIGFLVDLPDRATEALTDLGTAVADGVDAVVAWFEELPGQVSAIVQDLWDQAQDLFSTGVDTVVGFVTELPDRLGEIVGDAYSRVTGAFDRMWSTVRQAVSDGVSDTVDTITGLPGRLGDLGGLLVDAGRDLIQGLINGVTQMADRAVGAIRGVIGKGIQGAKDALMSRSPSKVFMNIGKGVVQGYTIGIDRNAPAAVKAAERLATATAVGASAVAPTGPAGGRPVAGDAAAGSPLIGQVTLQGGGSFADQLDELMFRLRVIRRGGVVAGG